MLTKFELLNLRIKELSDLRDWNKFHTESNLAKSISIEAAELLECFQRDDKNYNINNVKEELADVLNYCLQLALVLRVDMVDIINEKMDKNEQKYPINKSRGVSTKYTKF